MDEDIARRVNELEKQMSALATLTAERQKYEDRMSEEIGAIHAAQDETKELLSNDIAARLLILEQKMNALGSILDRVIYPLFVMETGALISFVLGVAAGLVHVSFR